MSDDCRIPDELKEAVRYATARASPEEVEARCRRLLGSDEEVEDEMMLEWLQLLWTRSFKEEAGFERQEWDAEEDDGALPA